MKKSKITLLNLLIISLVFSSGFISQQWLSAFEKETPIVKSNLYQESKTLIADVEQPKFNNLNNKSMLNQNSDFKFNKLSLQMKNLESQVEFLLNSKESDFHSDTEEPDYFERNEKTQEFSNNLEEYLINEEKDPKWSATAESTFQNAFDEISDETSSLMSIECHSTLCKLEIVNAEGGNGLSIFREILAQESSNSEVYYKTTENSGEFTTQVFFSREGHSLPNDFESAPDI